MRRGAVLSFPHTTLASSGPIVARIAAALHREGIERIILLGVLHSGSLPRHAQDAFRTALDSASPDRKRRSALEVIGGAFLPARTDARRNPNRRQLPQLDWSHADTAVFRVDEQGVTDHEFSLDTILAILDAYANRFPQFSPEVLPIYVGVSQCPQASYFVCGGEIAAALSEFRTPTTAVLATGDMIHYGPFYGLTIPGASETSDRDAFSLLRGRLESLLGRALSAGSVDDETFRLASVLGNDQRFVLPVLAAWLGPNSSARLLSLEMIDYSTILSAPSPCFVAAALAEYVPGTATVDSRR